MTERKRYPEDHWARDGEAGSALRKYLKLYEDPFNEVKLRIYERLLPADLTGKTVMDVGGGAGMMTVTCARKGARVTLLDAEASALNTARHFARREGVEERVSAVHSDRIPEEVLRQRFDIIIAKDIVEHIPDDQTFIKQLAQCQKPGGLLLLSTQNSRSLTYLIEGSYNKYRLNNPDWCGWDTTHLRFYTAGSLRTLLENAGYRVDKWRSVYLVPYDILSWVFLLRLKIILPGLKWIDLLAGHIPPFNRLGWNLVLAARLAP